MSVGCGQRWVMLSWAALLLSACEHDSGPSVLTQIVVVVDSDLGVPDQLDGLEISVTGTVKSSLVEDKLDADHPLPRTLGVVHSGGPLGPVRISALGTRAGEKVVERVADVYFEKDHTLKLGLPLMQSCATVDLNCDSDQTCDRGKCIASATPELPLFKGDDGPLDAGGWVLPMVPIVNDAGHETVVDATQPHDAGVDASAADSGQEDAGHVPLATCAIKKPEAGDSFYTGDQIAFEGKCVNVDGGELPGRWRSSLDGTLSQHTTFMKTLSAGTHEISLCVTSKSDLCAPPITIVVQVLPDIGATISMLVQSGKTDGVYSGDAELVAKGTGTGVPPLQYHWIDSFAGAFADGDTAHYVAPLLAGRHTVRLTVTDARNRSMKAEKTFEVHAPAHDTLFEPYTILNNVLGSTTINALTSDGANHYIGSDNGSVLSISADDAPATAGTYIGMASKGSGDSVPSVRDIFLRDGTLYLATSRDVQACDVKAGKVGTCVVQTLNGLSGSSIPRSVRVVTSADISYMVVGTSLGLWTGSMSALAQGGLRQSNTVFSGLTESAGNLWIAASGGLYSYTLGSVLTTDPKKIDSGPSGLTALVSSASVIWSSLSEGIASYDTAGNQWNTWTTNYDAALFGRLVSNDVRTVAITHPVINSVAHDVIWIGTGTGLSRFDPAVPSFTTYSKTDGLPDNAVLRAIGLPTNELLLATPSGLAIHRGQ